MPDAPQPGLVFGSICSGIEAASVAWGGLGWRAGFLSEVAPFPRAVLAHHFPEVSLHGDFTTIKAGDYEPIDLLVGGTPCQSFSVAGLRGGLADARGNLALEYLRLAGRLCPRWVVWENVPGVLSSGEGRDFGALIGGLVELGYGVAYRVLDAQYFGLAQRRRRVFVVGYLGDWRRAAAVLFEPASLRGNSPPSREAGTTTSALTAHGVGTCGADDNQGQAGHLIPDTATAVRARDANGTPDSDCTSTLLAFDGKASGRNGFGVGDIAPTLRAMGHAGSHQNAGGQVAASTGAGVRRLTPRECERLQGFPDDWTLIPWRKGLAPDGPRYKALGNSMAVPCMAWIGRRIAAQEAELRARGAA